MNGGSSDFFYDMSKSDSGNLITQIPYTTRRIIMGILIKFLMVSSFGILVGQLL